MLIAVSLLLPRDVSSFLCLHSTWSCLWNMCGASMRSHTLARTCSDSQGCGCSMLCLHFWILLCIRARDPWLCSFNHFKDRFLECSFIRTLVPPTPSHTYHSLSPFLHAPLFNAGEHRLSVPESGVHGRRLRLPVHLHVLHEAGLERRGRIEKTLYSLSRIRPCSMLCRLCFFWMWVLLWMWVCYLHSFEFNM